ncbi:MAG TPA: hypothetical protein VIE88_12890 [Vicinamibacteria bacterium]
MARDHDGELTSSRNGLGDDPERGEGRVRGGLPLPSDVQDLAPVFASIAAELRHQYLLAFEPDREARADPGFRTIEIRVSSPEHAGPLRVRGRRGYSPEGAGISESLAREQGWSKRS